MKTALFIISILILFSCRSKSRTPSTLESRYYIAYNNLNASLRKSFEKIQDDESIIHFDTSRNDLPEENYISIAPVIDSSVDTLNQEDILPGSNNSTEVPLTNLICESSLLNDSLVLFFTPGPQLDGGKEITLLITNNKREAVYREWNQYDTTYKTAINDAFDNKIDVPMKFITLELSDSKFKEGKTIYGYCELISDPYYHGDTHFKSRFIHKQLSFKYYFKVKITGGA